MRVRNLIYLVLFTIGCQPVAQKRVVDPRPKTELSLVEKLIQIDSVYQAQSNDIKKTEALEIGKKQVIAYIADSLKLKAKEWHAYINEIEVKEWNGVKFIGVELLIPKGINLDSEFPQYSSILLSCGVSYSKNKIKDSLSALNKGDNVVVSGTFFPSIERDEIDFTGNMGFEDQYSFSNPKFEFKITEIKKGKI